MSEQRSSTSAEVVAQDMSTLSLNQRAADVQPPPYSKHSSTAPQPQPGSMTHDELRRRLEAAGLPKKQIATIMQGTPSESVPVATRMSLSELRARYGPQTLAEIPKRPSAIEEYVEANNVPSYGPKQENAITFQTARDDKFATTDASNYPFNLIAEDYIRLYIRPKDANTAVLVPADSSWGMAPLYTAVYSEKTHWGQTPHIQLFHHPDRTVDPPDSKPVATSLQHQRMSDTVDLTIGNYEINTDFGELARWDKQNKFDLMPRDPADKKKAPKLVTRWFVWNRKQASGPGEEFKYDLLLRGYPLHDKDTNVYEVITQGPHLGAIQIPKARIGHQEALDAAVILALAAVKWARIRAKKYGLAMGPPRPSTGSGSGSSFPVSITTAASTSSACC